MAINLNSLLNYATPERAYAGKLENLGLITAPDLEKAKKQSIVQGLLYGGLNYLAQPKNQNTGSALTYAPQAILAGLQGMEQPFKRLQTDILTEDKLTNLAESNKLRDKLLLDPRVKGNPLYESVGRKDPYQLAALLAKGDGDLFSKEAASKFTPESRELAIKARDAGKTNDEARMLLVRTPDIINPVDAIQKRTMFVINPEKNEQYPTYFDKSLQKTMVEVDGKAVPFSYGMFGDKPEQKAQIGNLTRFNKDMKKKDFDSLESTITKEETSLRNLASYAKRTGDLPKGYLKLANKISAATKTFFDFNEYTEDEINQPLAEGQQQALLGQIRESVVGGGVMTEFDAQRVIDRLGGLQASALTNPEVVARAIGEIMAEKYQTYLTSVNQYNRAVTSGGYYGEGYDIRKPIEFDENIFYGANAPSSIAAENNNVTKNSSPISGIPISDIEAEIERRRKEGGSR